MSTPPPTEPQNNAAALLLAPDGVFADGWEHRAMTVEYASASLVNDLRAAGDKPLLALLLALSAPGRGGPHALTVVDHQEAQRGLVLAVLAERKRGADE